MRRSLPLLALLLGGCGQPGTTQAALGEPCTFATDCDPGFACFQDVPGGECTHSCTHDGDCGNDAVCAGGVCKQSCAISAECARHGFVCGAGYCVPPVSDGGAADLTTSDGSMSDLASTRDSSAITDLATVPDLTAPRDFASLPDLTLRPDLAPLPDLASLPDLAIPPDLAVPDDLTMVLDLATPPDLVAPADLAEHDMAALPDLTTFDTLPDLSGTGVTCTGVYNTVPATETNVSFSITSDGNNYQLNYSSMLLAGATTRAYMLSMDPTIFEVGDIPSNRATTTGVIAGAQVGVGDFYFTAPPTVTVSIMTGHGEDINHNPLYTANCSGTAPLHGCATDINHLGQCF